MGEDNHVQGKCFRTGPYNPLNGEDICINEKIFFFKRRRAQIICEAIYLFAMLILSCFFLASLHFFPQCFESFINQAQMRSLYAVIGGFLGGLTMDIKWFHKSVAWGGAGHYCDCEKKQSLQNGTVSSPWLPQKFFWRIFSPFVAAIFAFSANVLIMSGLIFPELSIKDNSAMYFVIPYIIGLYSDTFYIKLTNWVERLEVKK